MDYFVKNVEKRMEVIMSNIKIMNINYDLKFGDKVEHHESCYTVYDQNGNKKYYENSGGYFIQREYDNENNIIYISTSNGVLLDVRGEKQ